MQAIGRVLPLTHGIEAARQVADGRVARRRLRARLDGGCIGVCYAALAYGLLRLFEIDGRRRATLETM